jgi:hypothetical protein
MLGILFLFFVSLIYSTTTTVNFNCIIIGDGGWGDLTRKSNAEKSFNEQLLDANNDIGKNNTITFSSSVSCIFIIDSTSWIQHNLTILANNYITMYCEINSGTLFNIYEHSNFTIYSINFVNISTSYFEFIYCKDSNLTLINCLFRDNFRVNIIEIYKVCEECPTIIPCDECVECDVCSECVCPEPITCETCEECVECNECNECVCDVCDTCEECEKCEECLECEECPTIIPCETCEECSECSECVCPESQECVEYEEEKCPEPIVCETYEECSVCEEITSSYSPEPVSRSTQNYTFFIITFIIICISVIVFIILFICVNVNKRKK